MPVNIDGGLTAPHSNSFVIVLVKMASIAALRAVGGRAATRAAAGPALWRLSRPLHVTASAFSSKNPGPVETKLRAEIAAAKPGPEMDVSVVAAAAPGAKVYSAKIKRLADEIVNLTMLESMDLSDAMRERLGFSKRSVRRASVEG